MIPDVRELREKVELLRKELSKAETGLESVVRSCPHKFGETVYDPIYAPEYTVPGDKPGTMGVDWQGPVYVPARTEARWRRTCGSCGETQYTSDTKEKVKKIPSWPGGER